MVKIKRNHIYCEKHRGWFFSRVYADTGELPKMCPVCHRRDFMIKGAVKKRRK